MNASSGSFSSTFKRSRSVHNRDTTACTSQPPKIAGDIILQVFTHKSLRRSTGEPQDESVDNERLAELGEKVLETVVTHYLFIQRPTLSAIDISVRFHPHIFNPGMGMTHSLRQTQNDVLLSDGNVENWVKMYGMREKLRCHPDVFPLLNTPKVWPIIRTHTHSDSDTGAGKSFYFQFVCRWSLCRMWN
jgi:hypothetical protein